MDSEFDVSHGIRLNFLVPGGVSTRAVFRVDWTHDARINEFEPTRSGSKTVAD